MQNACRMKALRVERGFSQGEFAKKIGVRENAYNQYESGARNIPADVAGRAATLLGVSMESLFVPVRYAIK